MAVKKLWYHTGLDYREAGWLIGMQAEEDKDALYFSGSVTYCLFSECVDYVMRRVEKRPAYWPTTRGPLWKMSRAHYARFIYYVCFDGVWSHGASSMMPKRFNCMTVTSLVSKCQNGELPITCDIERHRLEVLHQIMVPKYLKLRAVKRKFNKMKREVTNARKRQSQNVG